MSWLKKMIFVDPDEQGIKATNKEMDKPPEPPRAVRVEPVSTTNTSMDMDILHMGTEALDPDSLIGKVDQDKLTKLYEAIEGQTVEGIDYVKFKKSVNSLREIQPDENMRFNTAYVTLKANYPTLTKDTLAQTIDHYIGLMEQERQSGLKELDKLRRQNIDKKEQEISKAIKDVEKMKEEIRKLTLFIAETNEDTIGKKNEYAIQQANFNATIDKIVNQLNSDKVKIETIIKQ